MFGIKRFLLSLPIHYLVTLGYQIPPMFIGKWYSTIPIHNARYFLVEKHVVFAVYGRAMISMKPVEIRCSKESYGVRFDHFRIDAIPDPWDMPFLMKGVWMSKEIQKHGLYLEIDNPSDDNVKYLVYWKIPDTKHEGRLWVYSEKSEQTQQNKKEK